LYYTIYRITNKTNGKFYIGKHQTKNLDDGYMGSGKLIRRAIEKYGIKNFHKEILFIFESEEEMNAKEKELVVVSKETYNLCEGGKGGFGYINTTGKNLYGRNAENGAVALRAAHRAGIITKPKPENISAGVKRHYQENGSHWLGKKHTEATKKKVGAANSIKQRGNKNSQYGTFWVTNGIENRKVRDEIPEGFRRGRI
jgi:hypothetical protein